MLDSKFALISAVVSFTLLEVLLNFLRENIVIQMIIGKNAKTKMASSQRILIIKIKEPTKVKTEIKTSSGPW